MAYLREIKLHISNGEAMAMSRYYSNEQKFAALHNCRILVFHSSGLGIPKLTPKTLREFWSQGYTFFTCFPAAVKYYLGFGEFIFDDHWNITSSAIKNGRFILIRSFETEFQIKPISLEDWRRKNG
jgi:hypothetical protein